MFKKSAAAYSIRLDEMKRMRDVMSTQQNRPYIQAIFPTLHLTPYAVQSLHCRTQR